MNVLNWNEEEYKNLPTLNCLDIATDFDNFVIVPSTELHESGFLMITLILCKGETAKYKTFGGSDIINLDGIGGYGKWSIKVPELISPKGWRIDCLPCGYLRVFSSRLVTMTCEGISDLEVFSEVLK